MDYILIARDFMGIGKALNTGLHSIFLWIDAVVYYFASVMYDIFIKITQIRLFNDEFLSTFSNRIYVLMGVIMLFFLAYSLLKSIIDPDQLSKGDKSVAKMVPNIVISLVIVGFLPTIFDYLYDLQDFILKKNIVGTLVFGTDTQNENVTKFGNYLAVTTLNAFLNPEGHDDLDVDPVYSMSWGEALNNMYKKGSYADYSVIIQYAPNIVKGEITYKIVISTLVGIYLLFLLLTFSLDLALRAVKLSFLQLIAPIPVIMRALPSGKKTFDNWLKNTATAYFEVFIRVFIMYMIALFARQIWDLDLGTDPIVSIIIIMGILMFAKEAPKLITDVLGLPAGNLKMGFKDFKDKIKAGGGFVAGAALGAAGTTGIRNMVSQFGKMGKGLGDAREMWGTNKLGALKKGAGAILKTGLLGGASSIIGGAGSGLVRGGRAGLGTGDFSGMRDAAGKGAKGATDAKAAREAYRARNGGFIGSMGAHADDVGANFENWITGGAGQFTSEMDMIKEMKQQEADMKKEIERVKGKYSNNPGIVMDIDNSTDALDNIWKKNTAAQTAYEKYVTRDGSGNITSKMSLSAIENDIKNIEENRVTREQYTTRDSRGRVRFDQTGFDDASKKHAIEAANAKEMLNLLNKAVDANIGNAAMTGGLLPGVDASDYVNMKQILEDSEKIIGTHGKGSFIDAAAGFSNLDDTMKALGQREREIMHQVNEINKRKEKK